MNVYSKNYSRVFLLLFFIFQNLDKENEILKEQLTTLRDEMEDATEKMNEMTEELHSAQVKAIEYKGVYTFIYFNFFIHFNNTFVYFLCNEFDARINA